VLPKPRRDVWTSARGLLVCLACLLTGTSTAQTPPLRLQLSLGEAVTRALRANPQVLIANLSVTEQEQAAAVARSALLPQATLEVPERAQRINIRTGFGRSFPGLPQHAGPFQVFQAGTLFSVPLLDLSLWHRWQQARHLTDQSRADQQTVREQITLLVVSQYLSGLRATADVRAAESRVELARALYQQAQDLARQGVATGLDALRAEVELRNEEQRLIQARTALQTTLYGLARLLNVDPTTEIELTDEVSFYATPAFEAEATIAQAWAHRPELKAIQAELRSLEAERAAVRAERLPALHAAGNWSEQGLSVNSVIPTYTYEVRLELPLVTGGRIQAEIAREQARLERLLQQQQDLRNQIAMEVRVALANLESARHEVEVARLGVTLAEKEVELARDRFQAGVANNIEVVQAQDALARAQDNQIGALFRYNQARAELARATGQMEALYAR
jgi:outer membrane protein